MVGYRGMVGRSVNRIDGCRDMCAVQYARRSTCSSLPKHSPAMVGNKGTCGRRDGQPRDGGGEGSLKMLRAGTDALPGSAHLATRRDR